MGKPEVDDLEAVRVISSTLSVFDAETQDRIIRWARERLGLKATPQYKPEFGAAAAAEATPVHTAQIELPSARGDLRSFVEEKNPRTDIQFAATIAYFYRFEAATEDREEEIDAKILLNACRLAGRERLVSALKTLQNAKQRGLLDGGSETGKFTINTVGENLVAMTLPNGPGGTVDESTKPKRNRIRRKNRR